MSQRKTYRTATVVIAEAEGVDQHDAEMAAQIIIRNKLADRGKLPVGLGFNLRSSTLDAEIIDVMDLGMAAGNGYLWTYPTLKAWREIGREPPSNT